MILDNAQTIATLINVDNTDYRAYLDPAEALANRPCFLVAPPTFDYTAGTYDGPRVSCRVIALSSHRSGDAGIEAMTELDQLLQLIHGLTSTTGLDLERAEPSQYQLTTTERVACYVLTIT